MFGINLDKPMAYKTSSLRFFKEGEHHICRTYQWDVLLLVFDGILRFTEDSIPYEVHPGEYHIQKHGSVQTGEIASDSPKYLYVHFYAPWEDCEHALRKRGTYDYSHMKPYIEELDALAHDNSPLITQAGLFFQILSTLYASKPVDSVASKIADHIAKECHRGITLSNLSETFNFSPNHIINIFKKAYGVTPIVYANELKLKKAEYLLSVTSEPTESISLKCGFNNYSHFYKLFVRKNKCSPEKWRDQKRLHG